jgi:hypothetical protein
MDTCSVGFCTVPPGSSKIQNSQAIELKKGRAAMGMSARFIAQTKQIALVGRFNWPASFGVLQQKVQFVSRQERPAIKVLALPFFGGHDLLGQGLAHRLFELITADLFRIGDFTAGIVIVA